MSKGLSLWFATSSILLLMVTAISISYSVWLPILFGIIAILNIGLGFIVKAKQRNRKNEALNNDEKLN